jgi:hypothetical protein
MPPSWESSVVRGLLVTGDSSANDAAAVVAPHGGSCGSSTGAFCGRASATRAAANHTPRLTNKAATEINRNTFLRSGIYNAPCLHRTNLVSAQPA